MTDVDPYLHTASGLRRAGRGDILAGDPAEPEPPVSGWEVGTNAPTWERPYATTSIWKRKLDPAAPRVAAGTAGHTNTAAPMEPVHMFDLRGASTVSVAWYAKNNTAFNDKCGAGKGALVKNLPFPVNWNTRHSLGSDGKNNQIDVLQLDGITVDTYQAAMACTSTQLVARDANADHRIDGPGRLGGQGASRMSHGGLLRTPDAVSGAVIPHALSILANNDYLSNSNGGYRWPAYAADNNYDNPSSGNYYGGSVPAFRMGSLVTLPAALDLASVGITGELMVRIANALKTYGGYIVDVTAWDAWYIGIDSEDYAAFSTGWVKEQFLEMVRHFEVVDTTNHPEKLAGV